MWADSYDIAKWVALLGCIASSCAIDWQEMRVEIENFAFDPPVVNTQVGTRFVFINRDQVPHSVVGFRNGQEIFRSPERIDTDEYYVVVIDAPGEILLRCGLHSRIEGKIVVTP